MVTTNMVLVLLFVSGVGACSKDPDLFITAPEKLEAISGSCLLIPCTFSAKPSNYDFDSQRETFGIWIKNESPFENKPNNVVFNSSGKVMTYPLSFTGNLRQKNCTTLFSSLKTYYTNTYFFRVENHPFLATAPCNPIKITVRDSPPEPSIQLSGELKEQQSVTITCSAFTPCPHSPPQLTWTLQQNPENNRENNPDGTLMTIIRETITLSDKDHGLDITCSATYPVDEEKKTAQMKMTLNVAYAPKDTTVSISPAGLLVNLTCSSRANPPVSIFTWYKDSTDGPIKVSEGKHYSIDATDQETYYCEAENQFGKQQSEIQRMNKGSSLLWGAIAGGIIVLVCAAAIWWFKSKHKASQTDPTQQNQRPEPEVPAVREPVRAAETDDIHYGEIDFSRGRSSSMHDSGQQQDTLYAQVKVSNTTRNVTQLSDGSVDIYSQVNKRKV